MWTVKMKMILVMLASQLSLSVVSAVVDDGTQGQHQRVRYNNVFFSDPAHMKGRPSTSFVMVKSVDGRAYQLSNSGNSFTYTGEGDQSIRVNSGPSPTCPNMTPKPKSMCVNTTSTCSNLGQQDLDCPDAALCCFDGCVNTCNTRVFEVPRVSLTGDTCPVVETKTEAECEGTVATCWSRGVPDVDCPNFGLCCYDGCVNTCKLHEETEIVEEESDDQYDDEYDESLADALDDPDEEYDENLDDSASDDLTDVDEYGAPAAPVLDDIDSYGSPLADTLDHIDSYGSPAADPITGYIPEKIQQFPSKFYSIQSAKSGAPAINPGITQLKPSRNIRGLALNSIVSNDIYKSNKKTHFKQYPILVPASQQWQGIPHFKVRNEAKRFSRKKLLLSERKKIRTDDVFRTLSILWKKHFGVFANF